MTGRSEPAGSSRRDVLKTGAVGMGALLGAMGMSGTAGAAPSAVSPGHTGPVDYFLKIDGIEGDSTDRTHKGEIQLLSFSWAANNASTAAVGAAAAGKVSLTDFSFTATTSKASPQLFLKCATGQLLPAVQLTVRQRGRGGGNEYIKLELIDVLVSSYQTAGGGAQPTDQSSLSYSKISYSYYPPGANGTLGPPVTGSWDLKANKTA